MTTQSGTLQQALGVSTVWLQASPNDTLTVTPAPTGTYSIEYPLGTIAVASATTTTTLAVDGGNAVIRLSSGAVTYSLVDKPDEAPIQSSVSGGVQNNPVARLKWFSFGDSYADIGTVNNVTAQDIRVATASNTPVALPNTKMGAWIAAFSGGVATPVFNGGIGGQTSSQIAARATAASSTVSTSKSLIDGVGYGGTAMVLSCTVNDFLALTAASSQATILAAQTAALANLKTCIRRAASLGVYTFVHSVMPYGASPLTDDQKAVNAASDGFNNQVKNYISTIPDIATYYDARSLVRAGDGGWIAGYSAEAANHVHPSSAGCYRMYAGLADLMMEKMGAPKTRQPYPPAQNMFANAAFSAASAGLATGVSVVINNGAFIPAVVEQNGVMAQQFVWTPGNANGTDSSFAFEIDLSAAGAAPFVSVSVGDVLAMSCDLIIDDGQGGASSIYGLSAYLRKSAGALPTIFNSFISTNAGTLNKPAQSIMRFRASGGFIVMDEATSASSGRIFSRITLVTQMQNLPVRVIVSNVRLLKLPGSY